MTSRVSSGTSSTLREKVTNVLAAWTIGSEAIAACRSGHRGGVKVNPPAPRTPAPRTPAPRTPVGTVTITAFALNSPATVSSRTSAPDELIRITRVPIRTGILASVTGSVANGAKGARRNSSAIASFSSGSLPWIASLGSTPGSWVRSVSNICSSSAETLA